VVARRDAETRLFCRTIKGTQRRGGAVILQDGLRRRYLQKRLFPGEGSFSVYLPFIIFRINF